MLKPLITILALVPATAAFAEDEVCGAVYTNEDFVGVWEMTTGMGVATDSAGSGFVPLTTEGTGPAAISLIGDALTMETEYIDFEMEVLDIDPSTFAQLVPDSSATDAEDVAMVVGCEWTRLQPVKARAEGQTPFGEDAIWEITGVVVAQNAEGAPMSIFGTFRVLGVDLDVQMTRTVVMTR